MTRHQLARIVAGCAAATFLGTAALHSTGFDSVVQLVAQLPSDLVAVMPAVWLVFSLDLVIIGLIVAAVAYRPAPPGRFILVVAAFCPLGAAALQLVFIGFVFPTAILLTVGALTLGAAVLLVPESTIPVSQSKPF
jgi:hypothetical protein